MKKKFFYLFYFVLISFFVSCNCHTEGSGIVIDKITKQPLENVEINIYLSTIHNDSLKTPIFTDKNGIYKISHSFCSDYMIDFYKEGYSVFVSSIRQNDSIFLEIYKDDEYK